ncbi:hypothetical protein D3C80_1172460 [compost metagenome]
MAHTLIHRLNGHLLEIRVVQPDLLAIGHQQLLHRRIGMPAQQPRAFERHLAAGLLQLSAGAIQGQLREAPAQGLRLAQQLGQALHGLLIPGGMGSQPGHGQSSQHQHTYQTHRTSLNLEPASARSLRASHWYSWG